jgi:hypothetical protein
VSALRLLRRVREHGVDVAGDVLFREPERHTIITYAPYAVLVDSEGGERRWATGRAESTGLHAHEPRSPRNVLRLLQLPIELRVYDDALALWMTPDGTIINAFEMPSA